MVNDFPRGIRVCDGGKCIFFRRGDDGWDGRFCTFLTVAEEKFLGRIIQKPGTIALTRNNLSQLHYSNLPTTPPSTPLLRSYKMNTFRAVSRLAIRARPTRSFVRTYADAAGPADKIRLSLTLPHQVGLNIEPFRYQESMANEVWYG